MSISVIKGYLPLRIKFSLEGRNGLEYRNEERKPFTLLMKKKAVVRFLIFGKNVMKGKFLVPYLNTRLSMMFMVFVPQLKS